MCWKQGKMISYNLTSGSAVMCRFTVVGYELAALRLWYLLQLFYCVLHDYPCQKVFNHGYGFFHAAYGFRFGGCGVLVNHFKLAVRKSHCATSCGCFIIAPVHAFSAGSVRPSKSARYFP